MSKSDILVFLSDQHHANYGGWEGHELLRTPNLDRLAGDGVVFEQAYTSCPLCAPSRSSFLTGQLPSKTGVFSNDGTIASDQTTFLHSIAAEGYETVLCGRMHFLGEDQRHGFTKRIMGEFTPLIWGRSGKERKDLGPYVEKCSEAGCLDVIGGGNSPVLEYDRAVIQAAVDYLKVEHDKPQCIVVGTYGPHFTYVAPSDLYDYYKERVSSPLHNAQETNYNHPLLEYRKRYMDEERTSRARAAYFGMIENLDNQVGFVREQWDIYLNRNHRKGIFVYLSDHGDQAGEHHFFGKQTFFEGSARIPMMFAGDGIAKNKRIQGSVSIMDVAPTLCELTGAKCPPQRDGKSLVDSLICGKENPERAVFSEFIENGLEGRWIPGRMLKQGDWKLISYYQHEKFDLLFNLSNDPLESFNLVDDYPEKYAELKRELVRNWDPQTIIHNHEMKLEHYAILQNWGKNVDVVESERWVVPEHATLLPKY